MTTAPKIVEIELVNPWTGETVSRDVTDITDAQLQGYALDEAMAELVDYYAGWETPGEWLAVYVSHVGSVQAGREIIGS